MSNRPKKEQELFDKMLVLEKVYWAAQDAYKAANKEYETERNANYEASKSPEEKLAEKQKEKCPCICGCNSVVNGNWYGGRVQFWTCEDCSICS